MLSCAAARHVTQRADNTSSSWWRGDRRLLLIHTLRPQYGASALKLLYLNRLAGLPQAGFRRLAGAVLLLRAVGSTQGFIRDTRSECLQLNRGKGVFANELVGTFRLTQIRLYCNKEFLFSSLHGTDGVMAPLWKSMVSKSSSIYRESLWSFSAGRGQAREAAFFRMQWERDRKFMLHQLKQ